MKTNNRFVITDTHFCHKNVVNFKNDQDVIARPKERRDDGTVIPFTDFEEHDEVFIENWNNIVQPNDKVYHLGDITIKRTGLKILERLNGKMELIGGNHDPWQLSDYGERFEYIRGCMVLSRKGGKGQIIFSHMPVNDGMKIRFSGNVHGHTHSNHVRFPCGRIDKFFMNICPEIVGNSPIPLENIWDYFDLYAEEITQIIEDFKNQYKEAYNI